MKDKVPFFKNKALNYSNVYRRWAFFPLLYAKSDPVAFIKGLKTDRIDSWMMDKNIFTIFLLNKAVALVVIEPFHNSISLSDILLS